MSGVIIDAMTISAAIIGGWVLVTYALKVGRLERERGGSAPHASELRRLRLGAETFQRKQAATATRMGRRLAEIETRADDIEGQLRSLDNQLTRQHEELIDRLDRAEADAARLRSLQHILESLPGALADRSDSADHRHGTRRPNRARPARRTGDGRDDEPLPFIQSA